MTSVFVCSNFKEREWDLKTKTGQRFGQQKNVFAELVLEIKGRKNVYLSMQIPNTNPCTLEKETRTMSLFVLLILQLNFWLNSAIKT
jgi:hypothetical protein